MKLIGLTGGIASGKSTVAAMLRALGARVIDADAVYHALITPEDGRPSALAQTIARRFPGVLKEGGELDRKRLATQVFASTPDREALNALAHPAVAQAVADRVAQLAAAGVRQVVYDVPLLYERGLDQGMHEVIVVWIPPDLQLERLRARDGISPEEAASRLAAQLPLDEKRRRATWVIDNSHSMEKTEAQVRVVWAEVTATT